MDTSLILSAQYSEAFEKLTDEQLGALTRSLMKYNQTGEVPSFSDKVVEIAFALIHKDIDKTNERRKARCQRNRENAQKRWSKIKKNEQAQRKQKVCTTSKKEEKSSISSLVNYDALLAYWNRSIKETGSKMPTITHIDNNRRQLIAARMKEYGNTRYLQQAFNNAFVSPFLNGKNKNKWVANLDWILAAGNFSRVLDGVFNAKIETVQPTAESTPQKISQETLEKEHRERAIHEAEKHKKTVEQQRNNIMLAIKAAERNPNSIQAKIAYIAYENGTMTRLGICWTPPVTRNDAQSRNRNVAQ